MKDIYSSSYLSVGCVCQLYLEFLGIDYERHVCKYSHNPFEKSFKLPHFQHHMKLMMGCESIMEGCEGQGDTVGIFGKNHGLNCALSPTQKADVVALQALIREKLHLATVLSLYHRICI